MRLRSYWPKRAGTHVTEVPGSSHIVFLSHSDIVVSVIEKAAAQ